MQKSQPLLQTSFDWKFIIQQSDRLWQSLLKLSKTSQEPKVIWKRDRRGYSYFEVYDPMTQKHYRFDSEQSVRIWLDRVRYQSFDQNS